MKFNSFEYLQYVAASSVNGMVFDGCGYKSCRLLGEGVHKSEVFVSLISLA